MCTTTVHGDTALCMCCTADSVTVEGVSHQLKEVEGAVEAVEVLHTHQSLSDSDCNKAPPCLPLVCCHVDLVLKTLLRMCLEGLVDWHTRRYQTSL